MLRNPLDVLTSIHKKKPGFYVEPYRLIASLNLYLQFAEEPQVLTVRYEDLVIEPERVQTEIAAKFGLETMRPFADCYEHFPRFKQNVEAMHSIRPIDADGLDKWRKRPDYASYLQKMVKEYPELISLARLCGYVIDPNELGSVAVSAKADAAPLKRLQSMFSLQPKNGSSAEVGDSDE